MKPNVTRAGLAMKRVALDYVHRNAYRAAAHRVLVIPASTYGSLGDLAMIEGLHVLLNQDREADVTLARYGRSDRWKTSFAFRDGMILPKGLGWLRWANGLSRIEQLYLNGADVLDGKYSVERSLKRLSVVAHAARCNVPCTITGFSLNEHVPDAIVRAFDEMPSSVRFCLRDPDSLARFNQRTKHVGVQVADLAFMVPPKSLVGDPYVRRIHDLAGSGRPVVALTPNLHCVSAEGSSLERRALCLDYFKQVAAALRRDHDCVFLLLPHDSRGPNADHILCSELSSRLAVDHVPHVTVPPPREPAYVKGLVSHCQLVITGRMHCGIAALGVGTPALLVDYQGKVKGLEQYFDMQLSVKLTTDVGTSVRETVALASEVLAEGEERRARVRRGAERAVELARKNVVG